jgi:hypothetical protein
MPFTVTHDGGMDAHEFQAYARLMNRWGIDVADTPRTPEPGTHARWLPAWEDRPEAERFAQEMRADTRNRAWAVYPVDGGRVTRGPLGPVDIYVGRRSDGCAYGLSPYSLALIHKRFPEARPVRALSIQTEMQPDLRASQGHLWDQVARIVTGLTDEQLTELGGYRLYEPRRKEFVRQPPLAGGRVAG